jgi:hypothetical protein
MIDATEGAHGSTADEALPEQVRRVRQELERLLSDPRVSAQEKAELRRDVLLKELSGGESHDS